MVFKKFSKRRSRKSEFTSRRKMPIVKLIKKVIQNQAEHKYTNYFQVDEDLLDTVPVTFGLTNILEGTGIQERVGLSIKLARIHIRYRLRTLDANVRASVRVYVFQNMTDSDPFGLPDIDQVWPTLQQAKVRYRILYDKTHQFSLGINQDIYKEFVIKAPKMVEARYSGPSNTLDIGKIELRFVTDSGNLGDMISSLQGRTLFTDL